MGRVRKPRVIEIEIEITIPNEVAGIAYKRNMRDWFGLSCCEGRMSYSPLSY